MRFLVDAQLPPLLAVWLKAQNYEADHVADIGLRHASDEALAEWACANCAIIITKDEDFLRIAAARDALQVVCVRIGNISNPDLLDRLDRVWGVVCKRLELGDRLTEVR